jgi:hypothetical protein
LEKAKADKIKATGVYYRLRSGVSNLGFHYLGAAKIIAPIGKAFAEAMVELRKT